MNILDYIPKGKDNAITRAELTARTGLNDRVVRELISQARRDTVIINLSNGNGYYIPTDRAEIERYVRQETARLKSIGWSLKAARRSLQ
jgi:hypothetical protein